MIQQILEIWSLFPLPFLKPVWTPGSSRFTYCRSLGWRILSITLLACELTATVQYFEHSLALPFLGIGMKTDLFHCWVFQTCWHIECSTFTASSFRIWNSSTGIPSPPVAFFVVMLSKAHLTSHWGCLALFEWSHHFDYLGCEDYLVVKIFFVQFFCVFLPPLLNIFCAGCDRPHRSMAVRSYPSPKVRGGSWEELPQARGWGGSWEELPHPGGQGPCPRGATSPPTSGCCVGTGE